MPTSQPSCIFDSGTATTLYVTVPARIATDSQFPFEADDDVEVRIEDERLVIAPREEGSE